MNVKDLETVAALAKNLAEVRERIEKLRGTKMLYANFTVSALESKGEVTIQTKDCSPSSDLRDLFRDLRARSMEYLMLREEQIAGKLKALGVTS